MKVIRTREMIETLQKYEKTYGVGIIIGFSNNIVEPNYIIKIANRNEFGLIENPKYQPKEIPISMVELGSILV